MSDGYSFCIEATNLSGPAENRHDRRRRHRRRQRCHRRRRRRLLFDAHKYSGAVHRAANFAIDRRTKQDRTQHLHKQRKKKYLLKGNQQKQLPAFVWSLAASQCIALIGSTLHWPGKKVF